MKTLNGFIHLESLDEIGNYIDNLKITRKINRLQVHMMGLPDYSCWAQDKKRWGELAALKRTISLDQYGKNTWNSSDGKGHFIAQNFNIMPDGTMTTGRDINSTPIGIKGWNDNAICAEIYGNFDKGCDQMTSAQRTTVAYLYVKLVEKLHLAFNSVYIKPHAWFTSDGICLGDYNPYKSRKTCPGTNFYGLGNTKAAFDKFYSILKNFKIDSIDTSLNTTLIPNGADNMEAEYTVKILTSLNIRKGPGVSYDAIGKYSKNDKVKITRVNADVSWGKTDKGWISLNSNYVESPTTKVLIVNISNEPLNIRKEADFNATPVSELAPKSTLDFKEAIVLNGTDMYKTTDDLYITASSNYTKLIRTAVLVSLNLKNGAYNKQAYVISDTLNVRDSRPKNGVLGKVKFTLKKGDEITLGYVVDNWASIYVGSKSGFVNCEYLAIKNE